MLFNSYEYIFFFLPITFFIYFYLNQKKLTEFSKAFLVFSSLFFYSWWNITYLPIILSSMLFNFSVGKTIIKVGIEGKFKLKKQLLIFGIISNISLLAYFKYSDFFIENFNYALGTDIGTLNLALPLAISFFTFQQIAYLVDSYKSDIKEYSFINYAIFVSFFPQLIAGPIVHHKEMMPQFANIKNKLINYKNIALGIVIFSIGLFKKVAIADTFAIWATKGFDSAEVLSFFEAWITSLSYTFQLYFDFSGYTDMAIGAAFLFNIRLPINFNSPYKSLDIQDFWRRWHITLSNFLKDYIYIPLGGNKRGNFKTYYNLMVVFLIGGLWHGAGWTFVFWGFLHGIALIIHRLWKQFGFNLNMFIAWFITFNFINITWIFFRAKEFEDAIKVLKGMIGYSGIVIHPIFAQKLSFLSSYVEFGAYISVGFSMLDSYWFLIGFILIFSKNSMEIINNYKFKNSDVVIIVLIFLLGILQLSSVSEFLYFNF